MDWGIESRRFFDLALDMLCIASMDGYFQHINPAFERVLGYSRQELLQQPFLEFVHPDDREATLAEMASLGEGITTISFENRYRCKDGSYCWLSWNSYPVPEEGRIYAVARDITRRKLAEERVKELNQELAAANQELEAFSYSVSHDLRAPLRAVDGFSRILLQEYGEQLPDDAARYLRIVRDNAQQMGELIDDLLTFSRLSRQPLNTERVALDELAWRVLGELREQQDGRQVEVRIDTLPACQADPSLLKQALSDALLALLSEQLKCLSL